MEAVRRHILVYGSAVTVAVWGNVTVSQYIIIYIAGAFVGYKFLLLSALLPVGRFWYKLACSL